METQVIEGTFTEVKQRLSALPLNPEAHLRVTVTEIDACTPEEFFANSPRRNGLILIPATELVTSEMVREVLYRADVEDTLCDNWEEKLKQM